MHTGTRAEPVHIQGQNQVTGLTRPQQLGQSWSDASRGVERAGELCHMAWLFKSLFVSEKGQ